MLEVKVIDARPKKSNRLFILLKKTNNVRDKSAHTAHKDQQTLHLAEKVRQKKV